MRLFTFAAGFISLSLLHISCKKDIYQNIFYGKIFGIACSQVGIDIEGKTGTGSGVVWKHYSGTQHANAITVNNFCYIVSLNLKEGDEVKFRISKENVEPGPPCAVVLCAADAPSSRVYIYDVEKLNK